tara:strand:- start:164 stop:385 length:222 start_codon:yes stop_codon:yes gene_type:complete
VRASALEIRGFLRSFPRRARDCFHLGTRRRGQNRGIRGGARAEGAGSAEEPAAPAAPAAAAAAKKKKKKKKPS